ncbi:hypothetical protein Pyn_06592 [Prunus yedoensis var. nudiflora]|uniref:Uncharacterized protein n=1 Tax=Prunus yedoensis var. nudiflora TaxID=2094558 RepID=A0A314Y4C1_PRUYE|nr:hypothetical protein Pyn_06592 [Prunus yedoensis var. nudiflora]
MGNELEKSAEKFKAWYKATFLPTRSTTKPLLSSISSTSSKGQHTTNASNHELFDQAVQEDDCHGLVIAGCDLELLVLGDKHRELKVSNDNADRSRHGRLVWSLPNWHGSDRCSHCPIGRRNLQGHLAHDGQDGSWESKNMLNCSSFYNVFCVEDDAENGSYALLGEVEHSAFLLYWLCKFSFCSQANKVTLDFAHLVDYLARARPLHSRSYLLNLS